jgi:hypothetical protein
MVDGPTGPTACASQGAIEKADDGRPDSTGGIGVGQRAGGGEPELVVKRVVDGAEATVDVDALPEPMLRVERVQLEQVARTCPAPIIVQRPSGDRQTLDDPRLSDHTVTEVFLGVGPAEVRGAHRAGFRPEHELDRSSRRVPVAPTAGDLERLGEGDRPVGGVANRRLGIAIGPVVSRRKRPILSLQRQGGVAGANDQLVEPHRRRSCRAVDRTTVARVPTPVAARHSQAAVQTRTKSTPVARRCLAVS